MVPSLTVTELLSVASFWRTTSSISLTSQLATPLSGLHYTLYPHEIYRILQKPASGHYAFYHGGPGWIRRGLGPREHGNQNHFQSSYRTVGLTALPSHHSPFRKLTKMCPRFNHYSGLSPVFSPLNRLHFPEFFCFGLNEICTTLIFTRNTWNAPVIHTRR